MEKLKRLKQNEDGTIYSPNGTFIRDSEIRRISKLFTLTTSHLNIENDLDELAERNSVLIPKSANSYVASEFNGGTQHIRKNDETGEEKMYAVYAIQFYHVFGLDSL